MGQEEPIERWTAKRRAVLVLRVLKGETSVAEAAQIAWAHRSGGGRLAGAVFPSCGKWLTAMPQRRGRSQGRTDQEAQTKDWGSGRGE